MRKESRAAYLKEYRERIKKDPKKHAAYKAKERERYKARVKAGK